MTIRVLLVDDEADTLLPQMAQVMEQLGFIFLKEAEAENVTSSIRTINPDVILLDLHFPGDDQNLNGQTTGGKLLSTIRRDFPSKPVVLFTTRINDNDIPLEKFEVAPHGSFDKPDFDTNHSWMQPLSAMLRSAIEVSKLGANSIFDDLGFVVGSTDTMLEVASKIHIAASNILNVIIYGESGTGKELVAKAIHNLSERKTGRFEELNCSGTGGDANMLESQLFGHRKGSYTGAAERRLGYFELANKGTLFLDEIQDIPMLLQNKLMKVIEGKAFRRIGDEVDTQSDFRLIVATNERLSNLVDEKRLRPDLAYRFTQFPISLPPLRDRMEDLPQLTDVFLKRAAQKYGKYISGIRQETRDKLQSHDWGGNLRELKDVIELAVAITTSTTLLPENITFSDIMTDGTKSFSSVSQPQFYGNDSASYERTATADVDAVLPPPCSAMIDEHGLKDVLTDKLESLPIEERYKFLSDQKDIELRKMVLIEFIRRLHQRIGKKIQHKILAEELDPLINGNRDYARIRQLVCASLTMSDLKWNK